MKLFLTGATGFIGQALVTRMRARDWEVHALVRDRLSPAAQWLAAQGCTLIDGDVTQARGLAEAMAGMDAVVHNAGIYELGADAATCTRMQQVNVGGTDNVLGAAFEAGVAKTVYVSTVWALGGSGPASEPSIARDESRRHSGNYLTPYERSKAEAHEVALAWRARGLNLVTAMPNGVMGANDHSAFGYFLRLYLMSLLPPIGWGGDAVFAFVDVDALAEGLCLAVDKAAPGSDYVFCGPPMMIRELFALWGRHPGAMAPFIWLPHGLARPAMAVMEPLLRALGLPAFMSRDSVDATRVHLDYSSTKAERELGWAHPAPEPMWAAIIRRERELLARRSGMLNKLRHQPVG